MKRLVIVAALALAGCGTPPPPSFTFPDIPDLSPEIRQDCRETEPLTGELADLVAKDADLAIAYADCRKRKAGAVQAYDTARAALAKAKADQQQK